MRNNNLNKTVNEVGMSYTHYLEPKMKQIWGMAHKAAVSLDAMKQNIKNYIYKATLYYTVNGKKYYTKKQWFSDTVDAMESKEDLYYLCYNSVKKAKDTIAR